MALPGYPASEQFLKQAALEALRGVGNATLGQWEEWSGRAYHVKRRLTAEEQKQVGEPVDIRGTEEAVKRKAVVAQYLPRELKDWNE